jgi:acyl carrier protein
MLGFFADVSPDSPRERKVNKENLDEIELTTELDSLEIVELTMALEQTYGLEYVDSPKS